MSSQDLYHERLVRLARDGTGAGDLEAPDGGAALDNPLCGDEVTVQVTLREGRVAALAHRVRGCILCQAAASVMGGAATGSTPGELRAVRGRLAEMLAKGGPPPGGAWADLSAFAPVSLVASRHGCALLPFDALVLALARAEGSPEAPRDGTPRAGVPQAS